MVALTDLIHHGTPRLRVGAAATLGSFGFSLQIRQTRRHGNTPSPEGGSEARLAQQRLRDDFIMKEASVDRSNTHELFLELVP